MNYNLALKGHAEGLTTGQDHDLIRKGHVAYQSICIVGLNTCVFIALAGLSKVIAENCWWPFMTLKCPWRHDEGSLIAIIRLRMSSLHVTRCLEVFRCFSSKRGAFQLLPLTYNGEDRKIDLTLGHPYQNSEIYISYILVRISIAESFKVIGHSV